MIVFFSDVHLTDGSCGETISAEAFDYFAEHVAELARRRRAAEVRVVLLGDGLDVTRTSRWLESPLGLRPWDAPGHQQERLACGIIDAILARNREAIRCLRNLPERVADRTRVPPERVHIEYVLGNHDWLVNRYRSAREAVASAFDLAPHYVDLGFPLEYHSPPGAYDVVARHGDVYDRLNYGSTGGRDAASLGDAVVIELLGRFPREVARELAGVPGAEAVVRRLHEVDNVRPYAAIPSWTLGMLGRLDDGNPEIIRSVRRALARCIDDFRACERIQALARAQLRWADRAYMAVLMGQARKRRVNLIDATTRFAARLIEGWRSLKQLPGARYARPAREERGPDGRAPRFVVYGHSHRAEAVPLGPGEGGRDRFYLNTGTWRSVWERSRTADGSPHFTTWKEMGYVAIYGPTDGQGIHEFEMWSGGLRDRSDRPATAPDRPEAPWQVPEPTPRRQPAETQPPVEPVTVAARMAAG